MSSPKEGQEIEHKHVNTLYTHTRMDGKEKGAGTDSSEHPAIPCRLSCTGANPMLLLPTWNREGEEKITEKEEARHSGQQQTPGKSSWLFHWPDL